MSFKDHPNVEPTLPASWYRAPALYELERRAVFAKHWLLITHQSRFKEVGEYISFATAGYKFFIIKAQDKTLNAFHNVCRHRAFPVVTQSEGKARILACKYHGWSYGLSGALAKAPRFDTVPDFDKTEYSLFKIHLQADSRGFVWVNLDSTSPPAIPWDADFGGVDKQKRLGTFDMSDFVYDHSWEVDGKYNWKTIIDNYNECYHCGVAHPGIAATTNLNTYRVETEKGYIQHFAEDKPGIDSGMNVAPTFVFPNASITMTTPYFYIMRVTPVSATSVSMQYEVYRNKNFSEETFKEMDDFFKQVEGEDKGLCDAAQQNLASGTYVAGPLHPSNEKGVRYFKNLVRQALISHRELERDAGKEIWPTRQKTENRGLDADEIFCEDLCSNGPDEKLSW